MAGYIGSVPVPQATETRDVYTATSNQTTFTTGGYTPNFVSVYLNGVHLARADYTATNGSDVVLAVGAAADDTVEIVSFNTFEVSAQTFTGDVTASGGTFLPTGDTAAGDDAAVGYAAADGLVLTGQGSTSDVTIKNDADATVMSIATGTTGATFAGDVIIPDGDLILGSTAVTSTAAELNILDGVTATAAEINLIDGGTARGTTALADGDGVLINDAGTMRMTTVQTVKTYMTDGVGGLTEYIASVTASNSANISFTGFDDSEYVRYFFVFDRLIPASNGAGIYCRTSSDGGSSYDSGSDNYHGFGGTTDAAQIDILSGNGVGGDTNEDGTSVIVQVYQPHNTAVATSVYPNDGVWVNTEPMSYYRGDYTGSLGGIRATAGNVNAIQFYFSTGNMASGNIKMYGIKDGT